MPQIVVITEAPSESARTVVYRERIALSDLESDHFSGHLVERVGWAVLDADELEHGASDLPRPRSGGEGAETHHDDRRQGQTP